MAEKDIWSTKEKFKFSGWLLFDKILIVGVGVGVAVGTAMVLGRKENYVTDVYIGEPMNDGVSHLCVEFLRGQMNSWPLVLEKVSKAAAK